VGGIHRTRSALLGTLATLSLVALLPAAATALPPGFGDRVVHRGLTAPTAVALAPDGRRFVSEKDGTIQVFDSPTDTTPRQVADLSYKVMSAYDRGLEQIVLDPGYPQRPYLYASYTYNARIGDEPQAWPIPEQPEGDTIEDRCRGSYPEPDLGIRDGCQVSGRVAQLKLNARGIVTEENVILEDWCQQFITHSIGGLAFDRTGALLIGGGEGATPDTVDTGEQGEPDQRCVDPPGEGGALRAQDIATPSDPLGLSGTVVRVQPDTGAPLPDSPSTAGGNDGRIVAWGLRNPFRLTVRPGTDELWVADVGWGGSEEINTTSLTQRANFGWPCFEGSGVQANYAEEGTGICNRLHRNPSQVTSPWFAYQHGQPAVPRDGCTPDTGAISGLTFDSSADFPVPYDGALFAADYVRWCIWTFLPGPSGAPRQDTGQTFHDLAQFPVDLVSGHDGLYYADIWGGTVRRISYTGPTVEVNAVSRPRGAPIKLAGRVLAGPLTLKRGTANRLVAPRRLKKGKRTLFFRRWSDGGRRIHAIVPDRDRNLRAIYRRKR
jgi:glucose/arabinose dehydrogenase